MGGPMGSSPLEMPILVFNMVKILCVLKGTTPENIVCWCTIDCRCYRVIIGEYGLLNKITLFDMWYYIVKRRFLFQTVHLWSYILRIDR